MSNNDPIKINDRRRAQLELVEAGYRWVRCQKCNGAGHIIDSRIAHPCHSCEGEGGHWQAPMMRVSPSLVHWHEQSQDR